MSVDTNLQSHLLQDSILENLHGILLSTDAMGVYLGEDPRLGSGRFPMSQNEILKICAIKAIILTVLDDIHTTFPGKIRYDSKEQGCPKKEQSKSDIDLVPSVSLPRR